MRLPMTVIVSIFIPPLATILAWTDILRRNEMAPPLKGFWIALCLMPILGPLLYLGIGQGRFDLIIDKLSSFFFAAALVILLVVGVSKSLGGEIGTWQVNVPDGPNLHFSRSFVFLMFLLIAVGGIAILEQVVGPYHRSSRQRRHRRECRP